MVQRAPLGRLPVRVVVLGGEARPPAPACKSRGERRLGPRKHLPRILGCGESQSERVRGVGYGIIHLEWLRARLGSFMAGQRGAESVG